MACVSDMHGSREYIEYGYACESQRHGPTSSVSYVPHGHGRSGNGDSGQRNSEYESNSKTIAQPAVYSQKPPHACSQKTPLPHACSQNNVRSHNPLPCVLTKHHSTHAHKTPRSPRVLAKHHSTHAHKTPRSHTCTQNISHSDPTIC